MVLYLYLFASLFSINHARDLRFSKSDVLFSMMSYSTVKLEVTTASSTSEFVPVSYPLFDNANVVQPPDSLGGKSKQ